MVDELARRGHDVHLTAERQDSALGGRDIVERLAARHGSVTFGMMPRRERAYFFLASKIRLSLDYLRYLRPEYANTPALQRRARTSDSERASAGVARAGARRVGMAGE